MFYFSGTDVEVAGASPETLVKLENGVLNTFPLAGTRPRGRTEAEDIALEKELLADEKELAEHNMLVELVRENTDIPCAIGFGISTPQQAAKMAGISDGAIVGSAIIKILEKYGKDAPVHIGEYVKSMKDAVSAAG